MMSHSSYLFDRIVTVIPDKDFLLISGAWIEKSLIDEQEFNPTTVLMY